MFKAILVLSLLTLTHSFGVFSPAAQAETPGTHPRYMHALSDLRAARNHLQHRGGSSMLQQSDNQAIAYIDQCYNVLKQAAADDGKNMNAHPHEDAGVDQTQAVPRALQLLQKAKQDMSLTENNNGASGARTQALQYLDQAIHQVEQSITINQ